MSARLSALLFVACSVTSIGGQLLPWREVHVKIRAGRPSGGAKMIIAKEGSDLHIVCEASANGATAMVEWHINDNIELTSSSEGVQTTTRNTTVNGQLRTLHTLIVRNSTARDTGLYSCRSGQTGDEVEVRIVRTDKLQIVEASNTSSSELRLESGANGTLADLTLRCVGRSKSAPQWRHNGIAISNDTDANTRIYNQYDGSRRRSVLTITRQNVTRRFAGRYQCVDTAYFQSDSDVLIVYAAARAIYPVLELLAASVLLVTALLLQDVSGQH